MAYFGARVIGKEAAEREDAAAKSGADYFGSRVTRADSSAPPRTAARRDGSGLPGNARRPSHSPPPNVLARSPRPADGLSIEEMMVALGQNPLLAEPFFEQELARPAGARLAALRVLRETFPAGAAEVADIDELLLAKQGAGEPADPAEASAEAVGPGSEADAPVTDTVTDTPRPETPGAKRRREALARANERRAENAVARRAALAAGGTET